MADTRNIWVGDWKAKLKEQNKFLTSAAGRLSDIEKKRWNNYYSVGQRIYQQIYPTSYVSQDITDASAYYANTAILREREDAKTASRAASSSSASKAASEAAKNRAAYEKALESAKDSSYSAGQAAAKAASAKAEYEKKHRAEIDESIKSSSASASKAASEAAKYKAEYEKKQAAEQADQERAAKLRQQEIDDLNAQLLEAKAREEQAQIDAAKATARASQYESSYNSGYTSSTPYYDYADNNAVTTTETAPADNTGRNVLILCGLGLGAWWLFRRRKRRGRA